MDKSGNIIKLQNSPSIETRIITANEKKTIFYFDRIFVQNDALYGFRSRFISLQKAIPIREIIKVEVQDGQKDFHEI